MRLRSALFVSLLCACRAHESDSKAFAAEGFELPERPVLLFYVDGLDQEVLEELVEQGELPRLRRHFFDRATKVENAITGMPCVTYANATSMVTGAFPGTHGVWSNKWFDRNALYTRNYESLERRDEANGDMLLPTLYESLSGRLTAVIGMPVHRGVDIPLGVSLDTGGLAVGLAWKIEMQEEADRLLADMVYDLGEEARRLGRWPTLVGLYLPAVDDSGHVYGPNSEEYRRSITSLDESIGKLLEAFAEADLLDWLTLVLTSDHGHQDCPRVFPIASHLEEALGMPVLLAEEDDGDASYMDRWERYAEHRVILTISGERQANVHLRIDDRWSTRPALEEVLAFPSSSAEPAGGRTLLELLVEAPSIELVAVRAGEHEARFYGRSGASLVRRIPDAESPRFEYRVLSGSDPLGYAEDARLRPHVGGAPLTSREWLEASAHHRHPDVVAQILPAFDCPRSGDLIAFAAPTWDFSDKYLGGHGGIERGEMRVPLYFAGPSIRRGATIPSARLVDVVPTILELVGDRDGWLAPTRLDGVSLVSKLAPDGE